LSKRKQKSLLDNIKIITFVVMDIGKKMKILRAEKGISQQQLADSINKTRALISHIEVTSKVNYYTLNEIAKSLNVSVDYFIDGSHNEILNEDKIDYASLSKRFNNVERENQLLNEIIINQKETISNQKEIIVQLKDKLK
jgi:transcriptional regulator with XRE-family HTH domain